MKTTKIINGVEYKVEAYFTTPKPEPFHYNATELDAQKKQADILVTAIDDKYTLWMNKPIEIKGRGVQVVSKNVVVVTESVYNKIKAKYKVMSDF